MDANSARLEELRTAAAALGDRTRLAILICLRERPHRVGELVELLGLPQPLVSHHLGVLVVSGWARKDGLGKRSAYALASAERDPMVTLQRLLAELDSPAPDRYRPERTRSLERGEADGEDATITEAPPPRAQLEDYLL